jgi:hypothetical protein
MGLTRAVRHAPNFESGYFASANDAATLLLVLLFSPGGRSIVLPASTLPTGTLPACIRRRPISAGLLRVESSRILHAVASYAVDRCLALRQRHIHAIEISGVKA